MYDAISAFVSLPIIEVGRDVLKDRVRKQQNGANYKGLCPFHEERHPSFYLLPRRNIFLCYGCGERGGPPTLALKIMGEERALRYLSMKTDIDIQRFLENPGQADFALQLYQWDFEISGSANKVCCSSFFPVRSV